MALKPEDGETFLREVDEELRREQAINFARRYGIWLGVAFLLIVAAIGGVIWWRSSAQDEVAGQGETLVSALDSLEAGNRRAAAPKIAELAESDVPGYRAAALFAKANSEISANNVPAAVATLRGIAADQNLDELYRQAALVRQTQLEFDALPPQQVIQRLRSLASAGSPWLGSAGELVGVAYLKLHQTAQAGQIFALIGRDEHVPASIRQRSISMAGALGVDAVADLGAARAAGLAPPAGAPAPGTQSPPPAGAAANPPGNQTAPAGQAAPASRGNRQ